MAFDKAIKSGKEHRKPYTKAKAVDKTCRNHGSCEHCSRNRLYAARKAQEKANQSITDFQNDESQ